MCMLIRISKPNDDLEFADKEFNVSMLELNETRLGALSAIGFECLIDGKLFSAGCDIDFDSCDSTTIKCEQQVGSGLCVDTECVLDPVNMVWRRSDRIINNSDHVLRVGNPKLVFRLTGGCFSIIAQQSSWCRESQAQELDISQGEAVIGAQGRSCSGYIPHFAIYSGDDGCVFDLLPAGDWRVRFIEHSGGNELTVEVDRFEDEMVVELAPGQAFDIRLDCLIHFAEKSDFSQAGHRVQMYAMDHMDRWRHTVLPVVYNTWFDRFQKITWESLETQLHAAKRVGCEVYVVDAGWFGPNADDWTAVGDWRENPHVFSERSLSDFADMVRAEGLKFGIWMEPERTHISAPIRQQHPEWFIDVDKDYSYPDICKPEVSDWLLGEISRVMETYQVKWLKIDNNFDFSRDPYRLGHYGRVKAWHEILDKLAARFPDLVVEGCQSGAMGSDMLTVSHFDTQFLSDTVDPIDILRLYTASLSRLAPRMAYMWVAPYATGNTWTTYLNQPLDTGDLVLCPSLATSMKVSSYHMDFALHAGMPGILGLSGNIAGLSDELLEKLAGYVEFYKKHREFIQSSIGIPLTPVESIDKRSGFVAIQLSDRAFDRSMVFVYNILDQNEKFTIKPVGLAPEESFRVTAEDGTLIAGAAKGSDLIDGISIECLPGRSKVLLIEK